jgi:hypothetical protein
MKNVFIVLNLVWLSIANGQPLKSESFPALGDSCRTGIDSLTGKRIYLSADSGPECQGGVAAWLRHLNKTLDIRKLPTDEIRTTYVIAFIVQKDGTISGERSIDGPPTDITKQLFAAARTIRWIPGKCHGKNVSMLHKVPVIIDYQVQ